MKYYESINCKVLYLSDRHEQISEIEKGEKYRHWYGLNKICEQRDDEFIGQLIDMKLPASVVCQYCKKTSCKYKNQFTIPKNVIVCAPKEYLPTAYVDVPWDSVIFDENIDKAKKIEPTHPPIPKETFEKYNVEYGYEFYQYIGETIKIPPDKKELPGLRHYGNIFATTIKSVISKIKAKNVKLCKGSPESNLLIFLNNLSTTIEWISYAVKYGPREHFFKPYLHYAFDLRKKYNSKIIILNTSLEKWVYEDIAKQYNHRLPKPIHYRYDLITNDSLLLDYQSDKRSCSREGIISKTNYGSVLGGSYGSEILEMVERSISFANNKGLKVGIITFKEIEDYLGQHFKDKVNVISHFRGHQGSNKYDDVDLLIIIGTFHTNPKGLFQAHYIITGEYLEPDKHINFRHKRTIIKGKQIYESDHQKLHQVKLFKLKEEHEQAIFRSGAHVIPGKIVINFGFVPEGLEKKLNNYKIFKNKEQLQGYLSRIKIE
ncbi:MAG: hypothetical protein LLF83_00860 [Methanobacterium sp.]|nr:hypothetical protein [Methanobacterium sp.]